jgi:purine-binding chemotaxis protein CheW
MPGPQPPVTAIPRDMLEAIAREREAEAAAPVVRELVPYLGFFLGAEICGLPLGALREVARLKHLRRIPGAPSHVAGLTNLRGEIVCALDARAMLGLAPQDSLDSAFLVALRGFTDPLGLVVDSIADVYAVDLAQIEPPPAIWPAERAGCFLGTTRIPEGLMGLLDLDRIIKK